MTVKRSLFVTLVLLLFSGCSGEPVVTLSSRSPVGTYEARLLDEPESSLKVGRNFSVEIIDLKKQTTNVILNRSADEGSSPDERFLWSKDGRYVLLVGKAFFTKPKWELETGEYLYLLYDNQERHMRTNAFYGDPAAKSFGPEDLKGIEFEEELVLKEELESDSSS